MYIERVPNRNSKPAVLLRESWREDGKVKKRTVANLSKLPDEVVNTLQAALKRQVIPVSEGISQPEKVLSLHHAKQHGHVAAVLGAMKKSGLLGMIDSGNSRERNVVAALVIDRILSADSKLSTVRHCSSETASTTLGELTDVADVSEHECYTAMDWLLERQEKIQRKLAKKHLEQGRPVLFDLSSSYFEGRTCPLAVHGYSRDHRGDLPQVNYGIYTNTDGVPVGVEVMPGNQSDRAAFPKAVERIRDDFGLEEVIFIGDRGMISGKAIDEYLRGEENADWITALTSASIAKLEKDGTIQLELFDERDLAVITHPDYPEERLIVCRNPALAARRTAKREELIQATEGLLETFQKRVTRKNRPLRGKEKIGVEVGKLINRKKVAKHFLIEITDESFTYVRNEERIRAEAAIDGIYTVRTSVKESRMADEEVVANYKNLEMVERAFRSLKSINLNVRPIYHRLEDRVRAHIFICMLAYHVEHWMRQKLAPLLFAEEEKEPVGERASVVAPVSRSQAAKDKDRTKRTPDMKYSVSSFNDILDALSGITRCDVKIKGHRKGKFQTVSKPSAYQQKILDLLGLQRCCTQ